MATSFFGIIAFHRVYLPDKALKPNGSDRRGSPGTCSEFAFEFGTCPRNSETQLGAGYIADFVLTIIYSMVDSVYIFVYYIVDFMTIPSILWLNLWQSFYEVH